MNRTQLSPNYDAIAFGRSLAIGQAVLVAWGYGLGFRAMGRGVVEKLNRRTVRVALTELVPSLSTEAMRASVIPRHCD